MLLRLGVIALAVMCFAPAASRAADPVSPTVRTDAAYEHRLAMARAYLADSHRSEVETATYAATIEKTGTTCRDQACVDAWKTAYERAIRDAIPAHLEEEAVYYATTYSEGELKALNVFANTPEGQSIAVKQVAAAKIVADVMYAFSLKTMTQAGATFCKDRPQYCGKPR